MSKENEDQNEKNVTAQVNTSVIERIDELEKKIKYLYISLGMLIVAVLFVGILGFCSRMDDHGNRGDNQRLRGRDGGDSIRGNNRPGLDHGGYEVPGQQGPGQQQPPAKQQGPGQQQPPEKSPVDISPANPDTVPST